MARYVKGMGAERILPNGVLSRARCLSINLRLLEEEAKGQRGREFETREDSEDGDGCAGNGEHTHHHRQPAFCRSTRWIHRRKSEYCSSSDQLMFIDLAKVQIYVRPGWTDMRKAINGLSIIAQQEMERDPFSGCLFLFCNRSRKILKGLYWDRNGFCLWQKRLEKHRFPWPETEDAAREITAEEFGQVLAGIDFWHAHNELKYSEVS